MNDPSGLVRQCAAVRTHSGSISVPPQRNPVWGLLWLDSTRATIHGKAPGAAGEPPITSSEDSCSGFTPEVCPFRDWMLTVSGVPVSCKLPAMVMASAMRPTTSFQRSVMAVQGGGSR